MIMNKEKENGNYSCVCVVWFLLTFLLVYILTMNGSINSSHSNIQKGWAENFTSRCRYQASETDLKPENLTSVIEDRKE